MFGDAAGKPLGIGNKQIITDELAPVADGGGKCLPAVPILFRETVFNRNDRVSGDKVGVQFGHAIGIERPALAGQRRISRP